MILPTDSKIPFAKNWKFTPQILILIILGIIVILGISIFVLQQKEPTVTQPEIPSLPLSPTEEIMKDLTVPEEKRGMIEEVSPEVIKGLTAPHSKETPPASEEIIKNLNAPQ